VGLVCAAHLVESLGLRILGRKDEVGRLLSWLSGWRGREIGLGRLRLSVCGGLSVEVVRASLS